jgi:hypothetical protein
VTDAEMRIGLCEEQTVPKNSFHFFTVPTSIAWKVETKFTVFGKWKLLFPKTVNCVKILLFLETAEPLPDMLARKSSFLEEFHE